MQLETMLYSLEAERLVEAVLTGPEFDVLDLRLQQLKRECAPQGNLEIRILGRKRAIIVFAYLSLKLGHIYLLSYHLERKGEPSPAQLDKVDRYTQEIQTRESWS